MQTGQLVPVLTKNEIELVRFMSQGSFDSELFLTAPAASESAGRRLTNGCAAAPVHTVMVDGFAIGSTRVGNEEFAVFV